MVARHFVEGGGVREGAGALIKRAFAKKSDDNLTVSLRQSASPSTHARTHAHIKAHEAMKERANMRYRAAGSV